MSVTYRKDPIIEAFCEFRFSPDTSWDLALPGMMYTEEIQKEFPHRETRKQHLFQLHGDSKDSGFRQKVETSERILFWNARKDRVIQVGDRVLALNVLKPYPGWKEFQTLIKRGVKASASVTDIKGIDRILLQYVNRIEIEGTKLDLENYFEFRPYHGHSLPEDFHGFSVATDFTMDKGRNCCRIDLRVVPASQKGYSGFLLTVVHFNSHPKGVELEEWEAWTAASHNRIKEVFEGALTERLKEMFEPEDCHEKH